MTEHEHLAFVAAALGQLPADPGVGPGEARVAAPSRIGWFTTAATSSVGAGAGASTASCRGSSATSPTCPRARSSTGTSTTSRAWLDPMAAHLKAQGAFGVRIGPPVVTRRWSAAQVKEGIADPAVRRLADVAPLERDATGRRRRRPAPRARLAAAGRRGRVRRRASRSYNFQIPLATTASRERGRRARRHEPAVAPQHQEGRQGRRRGHAEHERRRPRGLPRPLRAHRRARRLHAPRPLSYFAHHVRRPRRPRTPTGSRLWLAHHEGDLVAATIAIRVGTHAWYSYGASSTEKRDVRGSNAIQWAMIRDALAAGAEVYDLRGITDTLDADDPPRRADPVQGRHRRRGRRVRRRVGPAAEPPALQGVRRSTWAAR